MRYIVDRFEGELAVCESEEKDMVNIPVKNLPEGIKEGDIIIGSEGSYSINHEESKKIKTEITKLMDDIFE